MLLCNTTPKHLYYRCRRFEKTITKTSYIKCVCRHSKNLQKVYATAVEQQPYIYKVEHFVKDEVLISIIQALMGDDIGMYISTDMMSYYRSRLLNVIGLVLKDLGIKSTLHVIEPNQIAIICISYLIAIISVLLEKY